jgi:hypothetical protein
MRRSLSSTATEWSPARSICRQYELSGIYGLDFILDANSAEPYLIEINSRATQTGHFPLGPRRDLAAALFQCSKVTASLSTGMDISAGRLVSQVDRDPRDHARRAHSTMFRG